MDGEKLRLVVDGGRCDGHGVCALVAPELISLDDWGYAQVEESHPQGPRALARARRAVHSCPAAALSLRPGESAPHQAGAPRGDVVGEMSTEKTSMRET